MSESNTTPSPLVSPVNKDRNPLHRVASQKRLEHATKRQQDMADEVGTSVYMY